MKRIAVTAAAIVIALGGFFYVAVCNISDEEHWPDW